MSRGARAILLGCLCAATGGCDSTPPPMQSPGPPSVAFVTQPDPTNPELFAPLVDGSAAQVVHGPQGGYHIVVSMVAHGIWPGTLGVAGSPDDPTTTLRAFHASGAELTLTTGGPDTLHLAWTPDPDGSVSLVTRQLRLDIHSPSEVASERILLHVDLVDRAGLTATDEKHVIATPPTN